MKVCTQVILPNDGNSLYDAYIMRTEDVTEQPDDSGRFDLVLPSGDDNEDIIIRGDRDEFIRILGFLDGRAVSQGEF
jgi:hypothetical protein